MVTNLIVRYSIHPGFLRYTFLATRFRIWYDYDMIRIWLALQAAMKNLNSELFRVGNRHWFFFFFFKVLYVLHMLLFIIWCAFVFLSSCTVIGLLPHCVHLFCYKTCCFFVHYCYFKSVPWSLSSVSWYFPVLTLIMDYLFTTLFLQPASPCAVTLDSDLLINCAVYRL